LTAKLSARGRKKGLASPDADPVVASIENRIRKQRVLHDLLCGDSATTVARRLGWMPPVNGHTMDIDVVENGAAEFIRSKYPKGELVSGARRSKTAD